MKIHFTKLPTTGGKIQVSLDGGQTFTDYNVEDIRSKGIPLDEKQKNQPNAKFWADTFEAIIGAIGVDCGFDMNVVFNSYESGKFTVQGKGLLKYIESKKESDQKANLRNLI